MRKLTRNLMGRQLATALLFATALLWGKSLGPDAGNYTASDGNVVFSLVDATGGAAVLTGEDDNGAVLSLPSNFNFLFYGQSYSMLCVSTNGIIYLMSSSQAASQFCNTANQTVDFANLDLSTVAAPGSNPVIAPFWSDLNFSTNGTGGVYYETLGTAPNRQFVVEWYNAATAVGPGLVTFEAILSEGSNSILFQYQNVTAANSGTSATIGIQNANGQTNNMELEWSYNPPAGVIPAGGYAILYSLPTGTATSVNTIATSPSGVPITIDSAGSPTNTPATVDWVPTSSHTLLAPASQTTGGTQVDFASWSYGNTTTTTNPLTVTAQSTGITYTATFNTEYQLTASVNPAGAGTVAVGDQSLANPVFFAANGSITVTATAAAGYAFSSFSGGLTSSTNNASLDMNGPKNIVANFVTSFSPCDASQTQESKFGVADAQAIINQALGKSQPGNDTNNDGVVNIADVQTVLNAVIYQTCR